MPTTTFIYRVESDKALLSAVTTLYVESLADTPACRKATTWRDQLSHLLQEFGRAAVIETLMERVEGLSMRHAITLADLAERAPSELVPVVTG